MQITLSEETLNSGSDQRKEYHGISPWNRNESNKNLGMVIRLTLTRISIIKSINKVGLHGHKECGWCYSNQEVRNNC
jgi:hypothetical protein